MNDSPKNLRRRHYVDYQIQRSMIVSLVVLEVALLFWALLALYYGFSQAVSEHLYLIHGQAAQNDDSVFLALVLRVLGGLLLANIVALIVADFVWDQYVRWILRDFHKALRSTMSLNFRERGFREGAHQIIDLLESWRVKEQTVWREIQRLVDQIRVARESNLDPAHVKARINTLVDYLQYQQR